MLARDIMTPVPAVVTPDATVGEAAAIMRDRDVGFLPVVDSLDSMHLEGVITDRDLAVRCLASHGSPDDLVGSCMTASRLDTVLPDTDVHYVVGIMERDQVRRVPVVDVDGRVVGVLAQGDLARVLGPDEPAAIEELIHRISMPARHHEPSEPEIVVRTITSLVS